MRVSKLSLEEGLLVLDGKPKQCPYAVDKLGNQVRCGEWCALFTSERPAKDKIAVYLACSQTSYSI